MAAILSSILLGACSVVGIRSGTEEPAFTVLDRAGPVEIREYGARVAAETAVDQAEQPARSEGFSRLAGYIFGRNAGSSKIAMTAPVAQQPGQTLAMTAPVAQDGSVIRFFLPASVTVASAPRPLDERVRITEVPPEVVAVLRFSGSTGPDAVAARKAELMGALPGTAWAPAGIPFAWFYDPPWTLPPLRRNEVAVLVRRAG